MTIIKLATYKDPYIVKEGFNTVKNRIYRGELFFEVTMADRKVVINKNLVEEFGPFTPAQDPKKIAEKHGTKKE